MWAEGSLKLSASHPWKHCRLTARGPTPASLPCFPVLCMLHPTPHFSLSAPSIRNRFACHSASSLAVAWIRTGGAFLGTIGAHKSTTWGKEVGGRESRVGREMTESLLCYISLTLQEQTEHLSSFRVHTCPLCFSPPSWGQSPEQEGPAGQRQSKPPARLMQAESFQQVWVLKAHSSMSETKRTLDSSQDCY